jgi:hypothetical protein
MRLPTMLTGTIGRPLSIASRKMPGLNGRIRPSVVRDASGKTISDAPSPIRRFIFLKIDAPGFLRSTSRCPLRERCQPMNGTYPSVALAMIRS